MNYRHLRYFWLVAREGHLTRTAQRLHLSQSALSTQIRTLEEEIGHKLFERRGRNLYLTEAGRVALDHAEVIFRTGEELQATLAEKSSGRQVLRVGSMATLSRNFQLAFLQPALLREDIEVMLHSGTHNELLQGLENMQLDLMLTQQPASTESSSPFITHALAEESIALVGRKKLLPPGRALAQRLASAPLVLPSRSSGLRLGIDSLLARLGIHPKVVAEVDDMAMIRLLVREGTGLAMIPPIVVQDELDSGLLVIAETLPEIRETFHAVTLRRRFPNPLVAQLLQSYQQSPMRA